MNRRAALVLFTEPFLFPPTFHAASVLAERGWRVDVFGLRIPNVAQWKTPDNVRVQYLDDVKTGMALRLQYWRFTRMLSHIARSEKYDAVIGYDMMAALPAACAARAAGGRFIYHNHDLMMKSETRWLFYRAVKLAEERAARNADVVVFPQKERAEIFAGQAGLVNGPLVVYNCPRKSWIDKETPPVPDLLAWKQNVSRVVLYQGGFLEHRGVLRLIESMRHWNFKGGLLMVGLPLEQGIVERMKEMGRQLGVEESFRVLAPLPHDELAAVTKCADVGIGVLSSGGAAIDDPRYVNLKHLAGASNKIFEYMAAGLPVVCARGAGFEELLQEPRHGFLCDGDSAQDLASVLNRLFGDDSLRASISAANREAFLSRYNYDAQFAPVMELMESPRP